MRNTRRANGAWADNDRNKKGSKLDILTTILGIVIGVLALVFLVVIHELGHAIAASRNGVVVEEFGIGFPPRAWDKKLKNGVLFSLNWLPLGGFVRMQGESDDSKKKGDYGRASLWAKTKILLAGVGVNYVAAIIIFSILYVVGIPKVLPDQFSFSQTGTTNGATVSDVQKGSPAQAAGLQNGDRVTRIDGVTVNQSTDLTDYTKAHPGKTVTITYIHDDATRTATATLRPASQQGQGLLGVTTALTETLHAAWYQAPVAGVVFAWQLVVATFQGFGTLFSDLGHAQFGAASQQVAGPVGIFGTIFPNALRLGGVWLLLVVGLISLSLAIMNTLPIPALDGGRLFVTLIFRTLRKPLPKDLEEKIHGTGFLILIGLIILITVLDVGKLFR